LTDNVSKAAPFTEVGATGLTVQGGQVQQDFLRQLQGRQGLDRYREMADNHPVIGGFMHAIEMLIRSVDWTVEPADSDDQASIDEADFVAGCMGDMSHSWSDTISAILTMLPYGFSLHELVYKRRQGHAQDGSSSRFDDGRIGWRKLPIRAQSTITEWKFDDSGGLDGAWQTDPTNGRRVFIPIDRALLFRTSTKLNNPQGRSILRNAFVAWYYQRRILEIEAIGIERDLAGLPVAYVPPEYLSDNATGQQSAALSEIKNIVRNIRRDEQEGLVFPLAYDPDSGKPMFDLQLLSTGGRRQFDTNAIVARYDSRIAMSVLADFILLGHEKVGTQALSVSKISLFNDSVDAWLGAIADVFNTYAIPRLLRLNGVPEDRFPTLTYQPPRNVDLAETADYVSKLASAGALIPDDSMDGHLRGLAGIPAEEAEAVT